MRPFEIFSLSVLAITLVAIPITWSKRPGGYVSDYLLYGRIHAPVQSAHRLDPVHTRWCCGLELDKEAIVK